MAGPAAMREVIMQAYAARDQGRLADLMSTYHPDAVFRLAGDKEALAVAGAIEGHQNISGAMENFIGTFRFANRDVISMIFQDDRAAVHSRFDVTFVPTGNTFTTEVMDVFKFADGKIVELVEFADTAMINKVISG